MASWPNRMSTRPAPGRALHQRRNMIGGVPGRLGGLELDRDGVEMTPSSTRAMDWVARQAVAIGADRAREHERQSGRAVFQFVQRLGIGDGRIGMVDAGLHRPGPPAARSGRFGGAADRAARSGCRHRSWPISRSNGRSLSAERTSFSQSSRLAGETRRRGSRRSSSQNATAGAAPMDRQLSGKQ